MNNKNLPFILLTIGLLIVLIVPVLIQDGMFMDGVQYSCVARNMAIGKGSFWQPIFNESWWKSNSNIFLEQPPLGFWIQSLFYRVFGDGMYVDRFYSFFTAIVNAVFITLIWNLIFKNNSEIKKTYWIPILFWITIPVCFWSFQNAMLENTLSIFTLAAVYFSLRTILLESKKMANLILSGICIFLATLTKGLPGLFPLAVIPFYWLIFRNISFLKACLYSIFIVSVPVLIYVLFLLNSTVYQSLHFYFFDRLLFRINDEPTASSRFGTLFRIISELIPIFLSVLIVFIFSKIKKQKTFTEKAYLKLGLLFILIGLSATLPLMLTMVQKGFYFVPALPFFAIGFSIIIAKSVSEYIQKLYVNTLKYKFLLGFSVLIIISSLIFSITKIGSFSRDKDILNDVSLFGKMIPRGTLVKVDKDIYDNWPFQCYLNRYHDIGISNSDNFNYQYCIKQKNSKSEDTTKLKKVDLPTIKFELFKILNSTQ